MKKIPIRPTKLSGCHTALYEAGRHHTFEEACDIIVNASGFLRATGDTSESILNELEELGFVELNLDAETVFVKEWDLANQELQKRVLKIQDKASIERMANWFEVNHGWRG